MFKYFLEVFRYHNVGEIPEGFDAFYLNYNFCKAQVEKAGGIIDEGIAWKGRADGYCKALEEIEDITQNHIINDFSNWNMGGISDDIVADYVTANCKQILDIINKAKGE